MMSSGCGLVLVMGVAGSGKTVIAHKLADSLGYSFVDADAFHPAANIEKMSKGIPLNDADREPWLRALNAAIKQKTNSGQKVVLACSALKLRYRDQLAAGCDLKVVYLKGDFDLIYGRLAARQGHFMRPELLASQFADMEEPADCIIGDVSRAPEEIVADIVRQLSA